MDLNILNELLKAGQDVYSNAGTLGALGFSLTALLRVYRTDTVQPLLPKKARWDALPAYAKVLLPFLLSLGGAVLTAVSGGVPLLSALIQGLGVGLGSVGLHHGTKLLGHLRVEQKVKKDAFYRPNALDKAVSLALPIPKTYIPSDDQRP